MSHSPLPWKIVGGRSIETMDGKRVAHNYYAKKAGSSQRIPYEEQFPNAELIVQAVNHYQAVLSALEAVAEFWAKYDGEEIPLPLYTKVQEAISQAKETQP